MLTSPICDFKLPQPPSWIHHILFFYNSSIRTTQCTNGSRSSLTSCNAVFVYLIDVIEMHFKQLYFLFSLVLKWDSFHHHDSVFDERGRMQMLEKSIWETRGMRNRLSFSIHSESGLEDTETNTFISWDKSGICVPPPKAVHFGEN